MVARRIARWLVALASASFSIIAILIWAAPAVAAGAFGLLIADEAGAATVRSDLAGLFAGTAVLCGLAAWTLGRTWIIAAVTVLGAIALGRALGWLRDGIAGDAGSMAIELTLIVALLTLARDPAVRGTTRAPGSKRLIAIAAVVVLAASAVGAAVISNPNVQQRVFDKAAQARAGQVNTGPLADDALRVAVCGSSAPLPSAARAKSCVAVFAGGKFYVVDVGPESVENLVLWGVPLSAIGGVLLTHFHSDHIGDLGELNLQTWAGGRPGPLSVYGGPGIDRVVNGFNEAYRLDQGYRTEHHTAKVMPPETWPMMARTVTLDGPETTAKNRAAVVLEENGLRITAFEVDHAPIAPAYAYRFDYKGRSALITGDLKFHQPLAKAAQGVDLMVSEAIAVRMTRALGAGAKAAGRDGTAAIMHDIEDYHMTPEQAAQIANDARVQLLVFYHLLPAPDGALAMSVFGNGVDTVRKGGWAIAADGSLYTLPLGSREIRAGTVVE